MQEQRHDERPPEGTGDRGTSWYYSRKAEEHMQRADLADDAQERTIANDYADFYGRCADEREMHEEHTAVETPLTPNEIARNDIGEAMSAPEGRRQAAGDRLGLDHSEEELAEMARESQERHAQKEAAGTGQKRSSSRRRFGPGRGQPGIGRDRDDEGGIER